MKKVLLSALILLSAAASANEPLRSVSSRPALSELRYSMLRPGRGGDVANVVKFNPLALLFGRYSFAYERVFTERTSGELELAFVDFNLGDDITGEFSWTGFRISPQFRYYLSGSKDAPKGFNVSPFVEYSSYDFKISHRSVYEASLSASLFGIGANIGHQWLAGDVFAIDLYLGGGMSFGGLSGSIELTNLTDPSDKSNLTVPGSLGSGFLFNFGFALGFGF